MNHQKLAALEIINAAIELDHTKNALNPREKVVLTGLVHDLYELAKSIDPEHYAFSKELDMD